MTLKQFFTGRAIAFTALLVIAGIIFIYKTHFSAPEITQSPVQQDAPAPVVLQKDGLGIAHFGDSPEAVIAAVTKTLGAPTKDTGITSSNSSYGVCPGNEIRGVEWNNFYVLFGDTVFGAQKFFQYGYSDNSQAHLAPALKTDKGVTIGMTVAEIKAIYQNARLGEWLPDQKAITLEERSADKKEYLGGTIINDKLYWLAAGVLCGE